MTGHQEPTDSAAPLDRDRRRLLERVVYAVGAFLGALVAVPLLGPVLAPALQRRVARFHSLGPVEQFPEGEPVAATYEVVTRDGWREVRETRTVYVRRDGPAAFTVFSLVCTHLGCSVRWDDATGRFRCPCHGGVYDPEGRVVAGPPPQPLPRLTSVVRNGELIVQDA